MGFGYIFAFGYQSEDIRVACGVACFFYFGSLCYGGLMFWAGLRQVESYRLEVLLAILFLLQWSISYPDADGFTQDSDGDINRIPSAREININRWFPISTNSVLAGMSMISLVFGRAFTTQLIQETIHHSVWDRPEVFRAANYTTIAWVLAFLTSTLLYIIPLSHDVEMCMPGLYDVGDGSVNSLAVLFRIIVPISFYVFCALVTRFWYLIWKPDWLKEGETPDEEQEVETSREMGAAMKFVRCNYIFFILISWLFSFGYQAENMRVALGFPMGLTAASIILGGFLHRFKWRRLLVYTMEVWMLVLFTILFGLCFPGQEGSTPSERELTIQKIYPFAANGGLALMAGISLLLREPFTLQYMREALPSHVWAHEDIKRIGLYTTGIWIGAFLLNTLGYMLPYFQDISTNMTGQYDTRQMPWGRYDDNFAASFFKIAVPMILSTGTPSPGGSPFHTFFPSSLEKSLQPHPTRPRYLIPWWRPPWYPTIAKELGVGMMDAYTKKAKNARLGLRMGPQHWVAWYHRFWLQVDERAAVLARSHFLIAQTAQQQATQAQPPPQYPALQQRDNTLAPPPNPNDPYQTWLHQQKHFNLTAVQEMLKGQPTEAPLGEKKGKKGKRSVKQEQKEWKKVRRLQVQQQEVRRLQVQQQEVRRLQVQQQQLRLQQEVLDNEQLPGGPSAELPTQASALPSSLFSPSQRVPQGPELSPSDRFTQGPAVSPSKRFAIGPDLSPSQRFAQGANLSPSQRYTQGQDLSPSQQFSQGANLSPSQRFAHGLDLSPSQQFPHGPDASPFQRFAQGANLSPSQRFSQGPVPLLPSRQSQGLDATLSHRPSRRMGLSPTPPLSQRQSQGVLLSPSQRFAAQSSDNDNDLIPQRFSQGMLLSPPQGFAQGPNDLLSNRMSNGAYPSPAQIFAAQNSSNDLISPGLHQGLQLSPSKQFANSSNGPLSNRLPQGAYPLPSQQIAQGSDDLLSNFLSKGVIRSSYQGFSPTVPPSPSQGAARPAFELSLSPSQRLLAPSQRQGMEFSLSPSQQPSQRQGMELSLSPSQRQGMEFSLSPSQRSPASSQRQGMELSHAPSQQPSQRPDMELSLSPLQQPFQGIGLSPPLSQRPSQDTDEHPPVPSSSQPAWAPPSAGSPQSARATLGAPHPARSSAGERNSTRSRGMPEVFTLPPSAFPSTQGPARPGPTQGKAPGPIAESVVHPPLHHSHDHPAGSPARSAEISTHSLLHHHHSPHNSPNHQKTTTSGPVGISMAQSPPGHSHYYPAGSPGRAADILGHSPPHNSLQHKAVSSSQSADISARSPHHYRPHHAVGSPSRSADSSTHSCLHHQKSQPVAESIATHSIRQPSGAQPICESSESNALNSSPPTRGVSAPQASTAQSTGKNTEHRLVTLLSVTEAVAMCKSSESVALNPFSPTRGAPAPKASAAQTLGLSTVLLGSKPEAIGETTEQTPSSITQGPRQEARAVCESSERVPSSCLRLFSSSHPTRGVTNPQASTAQAIGENTEHSPVTPWPITQGPGQISLLCREWVGPNYQLFLCFGYLFAFGYQCESVRVGTGVAAFLYLGSMCYGFLMWLAGLRKVPLYWMELLLFSVPLNWMELLLFSVMLLQCLSVLDGAPVILGDAATVPLYYMELLLFLVMLLQWAPTYPDLEAQYLDPDPAKEVRISDTEADIQKWFPLSTNIVLGSMALLSLLATRPFTLLFILETIEDVAWDKPEIIPAAYYTTLAWSLGMLLTSLLYLVPIDLGVEEQVDGPYNRDGGVDAAAIIFRFILPMFVFTACALATRFWFIFNRPSWTRDIIPLEPPPQQQYFYPVPPWWWFTQYWVQPPETPPLPAEAWKPEQASGIPRYALVPGPYPLRPNRQQYQDQYQEQYQGQYTQQYQGQYKQQNKQQLRGTKRVGTLAWVGRWKLDAPTSAGVGRRLFPVGCWYGAAAQSLLCTNYIFLAWLVYLLVVCIQCTSISVALGIGAFFSLGLMALGALLRLFGFRRVWFFQLDVFMFVTFLIQWLVVNGTEDPPRERELEVQQYFPFTTNAALAGLCVLSSVLQQPATLQYIREIMQYDDNAWRHPLMTNVAQLTTWSWISAFSINTLIYLAPWSRDVELNVRGRYDTRQGDPSGDNGLTVMMRIVVPFITVFAAALFTRLCPGRVLRHVRRSVPFNGDPVM
eukprot:gene16533-22761_t